MTASNSSPTFRNKQPARRPKICIVTRRLFRSSRKGHIAAIDRNPSVVLREFGYQVDILYARVGEESPPEFQRQFSNYVDAFKKHEIRVFSIDCDGTSDDWLGHSYRVLQYFLRHHYDLVYFDDQFGIGYYPLLARRTGNAALFNTKMCVVARGASEYLFDVNHRPVLTFDQLRLAEIERRSIELADAVIAPSSSILAKYTSYGWRIPANHTVLPNLVAATQYVERSGERAAVKEIVFFGRLETGSGLWLFCRALDRLSWQLKDFRVTFLGESTIENGNATSETLLRHSTKWPFEFRLLTNFSPEQAISYLEGRGRVAVIGRSEELHSGAVTECVCRGIPFLVCSSGGARELLDEVSQHANMFEPTVDQLCEKLKDIRQLGAAIGRPKSGQQSLRSAFKQSIEQLLSSGRIEPDASEVPADSDAPILIVVVPPEYSADDVLVRLKQTIADFEGNIRIELLVTKLRDLNSYLESGGEGLPVRIHLISEFSEVAKSIAGGAKTIVGLCHIAQILPAAWVKRGRTCFELENDLFVLTGMAAHEIYSDTASSELDVDAVRLRQNIIRYLTGNTPPLFPLIQETNSGFALLRSEVLLKCSDIGPIDEQYDRLKSMRDWIHEMVVTLHSRGVRFELVPDLVVQQALDEVPFEVFRIEQFMRSLPKVLYQFVLGSDQSMLARIAVDWGLERERALSHSKYVSQISDRIGRTVANFPLYTPWEEHARQLAAIAHAGGQIDLATELCAAVAMPVVDKPSSLPEHVRSGAEGESIDIVGHLFARRRSLKFGDNAWVSWDDSGIEMSASSEFELPSLNLSNVNHFAANLMVRGKFADPIKFQLELMSQHDTHCWSGERTCGPNEEQTWEFQLPDSARCECTVRFKTTVEQVQSPAGEVIVRWNNPRFIWRP